MLIIIGAIAACSTGIGIGVFISRKRFVNNIKDAENTECSVVDENGMLCKEVTRFEQFKTNLVTVKGNVEELDIPVPDEVSNFDDAESSLDKLNDFFEEYSSITTGTEAFILSLLPVSQTGEALCSFAAVAPDLLSNAFTDSVTALKEGMTIPGVDDISDCLSKFCEGMAHVSHHGLISAFQNHDYFGALLKPVKSGLMEMSGLNDAAGSLAGSLNDMGDALGEASELNINPEDFTDLDFSGHIPVMTIAISSIREFNLLMEDKTDAISSLKNISLDAVGSGGGGLVGAKAGAFIGSMFGPLGTLVGGIVGGIGGAMGGRAITNEIKMQPFQDAIDEYKANADCMKSETDKRSRSLLDDIRQYSCEKRNEFKSNQVLKELPIVDNGEAISGIALIIYKAVIDQTEAMKSKIKKIRSSLWYSDSKYGSIVSDYERRLAIIKSHIPAIDNIKSNPKSALNTLLDIQIPNQKSISTYKSKYLECTKQLKNLNDKNSSSLLVWSYMVDGVYQKTMKEIGDYSNSQMKDFNSFVSGWKNKMSALERKVTVEKDKLGIK